jgi:hypothetical protein
MTLAELLDKLERGRIGHSEAMRWLGVDSYAALVEIVHANGRQVPGHRARIMVAETRTMRRPAKEPVAPHGLHGKVVVNAN